MTHLGFQKWFSQLEDKTTAHPQGYWRVLWSATNMISASGSQHQMLFVPDSLLLCFCYPKEPVECWATAQLGKKATGTCSGTPQQIPGVCWSISEQGQCLPVGVTEHLLQGSPTRQMSWPHHSIYNYFMMHSQELRKVSLFKKRNPSAHSELPLLQNRHCCVFIK